MFNPTNIIKRIPIGVDSFAELVSQHENFLFVDKTLFIKELIDRGTKVSLIIRPRRWGKTLNMSMLRYFFASQVNGYATKGLFDVLKIAEQDHGAYITRHQGKHPVIFMSFKNIKEKTLGLFFEAVAELIASLYREHADYLLSSDQLSPSQKTLYQSMLSNRATQAQLKNGLKFLSECLYTHHKQKVMILIDEYDTPLNAAYNQPHFEELVDFFKGILGAALKGNDAIEKGIMTGILRLSKNKMLSDINNLFLYSLMEPQYSEYFGFSTEELKMLLAQSKVHVNIKDIQFWYNGYRAGNATDIYNPWSILNCIQSHGALKPYWVKTGDEGLLRAIFAQSNKAVEDKLVTLLENNAIESKIDEYIAFEQIQEAGEVALWSLLWATGYLKLKEKPKLSETGDMIGLLEIPNQEIRFSYRAVFPKWIRALNRVKYDSFLKNLVQGQVEDFIHDLKAYFLGIPSWFDFPNESNYHTFLLGLSSSLQETHRVFSNRESGAGRPDLILIPKDSTETLGIILEFKRAEKGQASEVYKNMAIEGLAQITQKQYSAVLRDYPPITTILKLCLVFHGKDLVYQYCKEQNDHRS